MYCSQCNTNLLDTWKKPMCLININPHHKQPINNPIKIQKKSSTHIPIKNPSISFTKISYGVTFIWIAYLWTSFFHIGTKPSIELIFKNIVNMHVERNATSSTRNQVPMILQWNKFLFELGNLCHLAINNGIKIYLNVLLVAWVCNTTKSPHSSVWEKKVGYGTYTHNYVTFQNT